MSQSYTVTVTDKNGKQVKSTTGWHPDNALAGTDPATGQQLAWYPGHAENMGSEMPTTGAPYSISVSPSGWAATDPSRWQQAGGLITRVLMIEEDR